MINNKHVIIVIVTFNPTLDFFKCNLLLSEFQYVIVDNSESLPQDFIQTIQLYTNVALIRNSKNLGIAEALNIGCAWGIQHGFQVALLMDQDSSLNASVLDGLLSYYNSYSNLCVPLAVVSPLHIVQTGQAINAPLSIEEKVTNGIFTMSSGNLVNLVLWEKIKGFNQQLFIDMVDVEYYIRALKAGYAVHTLNYLPMQHNLGNSQLRKVLWFNINVLHHDHLRKYYQVRNILWLVNTYSEDVTEVKVFYRMLLDIFIGVILFESSKVRKICFMLKGGFDYLRGKLGKIND